MPDFLPQRYSFSTKREKWIKWKLWEMLNKCSIKTIVLSFDISHQGVKTACWTYHTSSSHPSSITLPGASVRGLLVRAWSFCHFFHLLHSSFTIGQVGMSDVARRALCSQTPLLDYSNHCMIALPALTWPLCVCMETRCRVPILWLPVLARPS